MVYKVDRVVFASRDERQKMPSRVHYLVRSKRVNPPCLSRQRREPAARDLIHRMGRDVLSLADPGEIPPEVGVPDGNISQGKPWPRTNAMLLTQQAVRGDAGNKRSIRLPCRQSRDVEKRKESLARPGIAGTQDAELSEMCRLHP